MNFKQLVTHNILRNGRTYAAYFFSSVFSVMVFFIFSLLVFHPDFSKQIQGSSNLVSVLAEAGLSVAQVIIVFMSFVFLWYAFSVFLKSRKRDFSIYLIVGMSKKDLQRMVFFENLVLALVSIVTGIALGTLFSKVILLIAQNLLAIHQDLAFYLPVKPALVTFVIYLSLFMLLAAFTTLRLETEDLAEMGKAEEKPLPAPKANPAMAGLAVLLILAGYANLMRLKGLISQGGDTTFAVLICLGLTVVLTVLGTYLFFQQTSVGLLTFLQKRPDYLKANQLLLTSNLVYRLKQNALMNFMIAIVAAVAFVAIGVTLALGGEDFASSQGSNYAYVYNTYDQGMTEAFHQENIQGIEREIKKAGYKSLTQKLKILYLTEEGDPYGNGIIPASTYNQMAEFNGQKKLTPKDHQIIFFATTNKDLKKIIDQGLDKKSTEITVNYTENMEKIPANYTHTRERYGTETGNLGVVSDGFYQEVEAAQAAFKEQADGYDLSSGQTYVVHYREWAENPDLAVKINGRLTERLEKNNQAQAEFNQELEEISYEDYSPAQVARQQELSDQYFSFVSLYSVWHGTKQANGIILLISVLVGAVFFSFAAFILYFRLFGDLDRDGAYHHALHTLGVSASQRHRLVTEEMLVMYFAPVVIALIHFGVAMFAFGLIIELPVGLYFLQVGGIYLVCQFIFFLVSRWRYLFHLERLV